MRTLFIIPLVLMSLASFPSWSLTIDNLVQREGVFYKKFTVVPFNGEVDEDRTRVLVKNGKMQGNFARYHDNEQLMLRGYIKNGALDGASEYYNDNGQLSQKGTYKNDKMEGFWEGYNEDGTVDTEYTGTFKNGVKVGN